MKRGRWEDLQQPLRYSGPRVRREERREYEDLTAAELYCSRCGMAVPVRERLLLVLPDGELYEYLCVRCGASVGEKTARGQDNIKIIMT